MYLQHCTGVDGTRSVCCGYMSTDVWHKALGSGDVRCVTACCESRTDCVSISWCPVEEWIEWTVGTFQVKSAGRQTRQKSSISRAAEYRCPHTSLSVINEEMPKFELLHSGPQFEVRRYADCTVIETPNNNESSSFMALADYIGVRGNPQNARREAIAMTAPVIVNEKAKMQFVLPSKLGPAAPAPTDARVTVKSLPPKVVAVSRFTGNLQQAHWEAKRDELVAAVTKSGAWKVTAPLKWETYRYNPPWSLPWTKTNEVAVEVQAA